MVTILEEQYKDPNSFLYKQQKQTEETSTYIKRLTSNLSATLEKPIQNLFNIQYSSFNGLFDNRLVAKVEKDLQGDNLKLLDNLYDPKLLRLIAEQIIVYYQLLLFDQRLLISKYYIMNGQGQQSKFDKEHKEMKATLSKFFRVKYKNYYIEYEKIKLDENYIQAERDAVYKLGVNRFDTWKFAFCVLALRNKNSTEFINIFKNEEYSYLDVNNLTCLECFADVFHNAYKAYRKTVKKTPQ